MNVLFWTRNANILQNNAEISKIKGAEVQKGIYSDTTYGYVLTCQNVSF